MSVLLPMEIVSIFALTLMVPESAVVRKGIGWTVMAKDVQVSTQIYWELSRIYVHFNADIDECEESIDDCTGNALCVNEIGSFRCTCPTGYTLNDSISCRGQLDRGLIIHACVKKFLYRVFVVNPTEGWQPTYIN